MRLVPRIGIHSVQGNGWKWPVVLPAYDGKACPDCGGAVIGSNHAGQHHAWHQRVEGLEEAVRTLARAVRMLAREAGHDDWYGGGEDQEEPGPVDGYVVGHGQLPAETRGGDG